jgi:hypothetical protein
VITPGFGSYPIDSNTGNDRTGSHALTLKLIASLLAVRTQELIMAFHCPPNLLFKSLGVGILGSIALGGLSFGAASVFDAVSVYIAPARLIIPITVTAFPPRLMDWLIPDGGPPAGIFLILVSAVLFWSILIGAIYFAWGISKPRRASPVTKV